MDCRLFGKVDWIKISLILCGFGFLKEFRPGEPFVTDYLTEWKNFTITTVTEEIYPIGTYSYLSTLILIFLITDLLCYKPIIILCGISGIVTFTMLTFSKSLIAMKFVELSYGLYLSTELAYYTYIYAKVDKEHYQKVSSYTRSAFLLGKFFAGICSQGFVSFNLLNYHELNYLTIGGQILATVVAFLLPPVKQSAYFNPRSIPQKFSNNREKNLEYLSGQKKIIFNNIDKNGSIEPNDNHLKKSFVKKIQRAYFLLWKDFLKAYTNLHVVKWSFWWAAASCGYLQIVSYSQPIWQTAVEDKQNIYNGAVEAIYSIIGAGTVFLIGLLKLNWSFLGEAFIAVFTFVDAIILLIISKNYNIWILYTLYIIFGVIYHTIITVASFEIAKKISDDNYGLVFGVNITMSLAMQSLLTYVVTSGRVFKLDIRTQFVVYSGYFVVLAVLFAVMAIFTITRKIKRGEELKIWKTDSIRTVDHRVNEESVERPELNFNHVVIDC